ncbi:MAG: hypothetical protein Q8N56_03970 [bacterium]|nr:hypothetical protein [bacterium]
MDITFNTIYKIQQDVFHDHAVDLQKGTWFDPWTIGLACLKAIEFKDQLDKQLILPSDQNMLSYLKRMHFHELFSELTYKSFLAPLEKTEVNEKDNDNVCEILHCIFRDDLEARLGSKIRRMFFHFGLNENEEPMATSLVGELGNNVFDHNDGQWPTSVRGAIILAQMNPQQRMAEVVVADPGIGFSGSLKALNPNIANDVDAIKLGLTGATGRIGERRGQGLQIVQDWTIKKFAGIVKIHSGSGLVVVDADGQHVETVFPVVGTLASFVVKYK